MTVYPANLVDVYENFLKEEMGVPDGLAAFKQLRWFKGCLRRLRHKPALFDFRFQNPSCSTTAAGRPQTDVTAPVETPGEQGDRDGDTETDPTDAADVEKDATVLEVTAELIGNTTVSHFLKDTMELVDMAAEVE
eukprot:g1545.t1